jgi:DNA-binding NarL/FixJ family response regulator
MSNSTFLAKFHVRKSKHVWNEREIAQGLLIMTQELRKTVKQYQIEERRRQVVIMIAQGMTEVEIGRNLGVDASTISTDIRPLN